MHKQQVATPNNALPESKMPLIPMSPLFEASRSDDGDGPRVMTVEEHWVTGHLGQSRTPWSSRTSRGSGRCRRDTGVCTHPSDKRVGVQGGACEAKERWGSWG